MAKLEPYAGVYYLWVYLPSISAAVLFAASVYMVFGRLIRSIEAEKYSIVRINWPTRTFVASDVLSFLVQGSGAGLMATGSSPTTGGNVIIGGLMIQVVMFGLFMVTSVVFQLRMNRGSRGQIFDAGVPWKTHLHVLDAASALIMARSIFRVIEYAMRQKVYLLSHEWTLYIFDSLLMWTAIVKHGRVVSGDDSHACIRNACAGHGQRE